MRLEQQSMILSIFASAVAMMALLSSGAIDQVAAAEPEVVAKNLDNPTGVAVSPKTGHVFVASHAGVFRYDPASGNVTPEIVGYPTDVYGKGPMYNIGPLGVAFLGDDHLVVGDGSRVDLEELVRVYKISDTPPDSPQKETDAVATLGPFPYNESTTKGEGNFYGVTVSDSAIYVTCNGDDTKGWVAKAQIVDGKPGKLELAIATKEATGVDAPVPITMSPNGNLVVVGQMGEINIPGDSLLTFYNAKSGKMRRNAKLGLNDVTGLAYAPESNRLYATDFSWLDTSKGALYRITKVNSEEPKTRKVCDLDKPSAIAFDADGNLYIAVMGTAKEGSDEAPGQLLKINAGDL